jgi:hypothetical protein
MTFQAKMLAKRRLLTLVASGAARCHISRNFNCIVRVCHAVTGDCLLRKMKCDACI